MAGVWFTELQSRPMASLDCTSLTLGLHKDSCKSGHRTQREVLPDIIRAVLGGIIHLRGCV
jgi:hypothetical protein